MSFEPKLYNDPQPHSDGADEPVWDDAEKLELPDDLAMFADQLRDDAAYLAQQHPPMYDGLPRPSSIEEKPGVDVVTSTSQVLRRVSTAAAILLVASVGSWAAWQWNQTDGETPQGVATTQANTPNRHIARPIPVSSAIIELPGVLREPTEQPRMIPAAFLRDVSGPELDGMLDLLDDDESGLSI